MAGRVAGKVALVVGGGQTAGLTVGNGRAVAIVLGREGARVVVADRNVASAEETAALIRAEGGEAAAMAVDVTQEDSVRLLVEGAVARFGGLHILHNNVGANTAAGDAPPLEISEAAFDRIVSLNFKSAWFAARHAIPVFRRLGGGSIVNISSIAGRRPYPNLGYKTTKTALIGFTEQLAAQNAKYNIRVNAILPGVMDTPMAIESKVAAGADREKVQAQRASRVPLGRMGTGWDIGYAALYLHSDEAAFVTGVALPVDGGECVADTGHVGQGQ